MSLEIKRAVSLPFNSLSGWIALAIGSLLSVPDAWLESHQGLPTWVTALAYAGILLNLGYQVRVMRAELNCQPPAKLTVLPSWFGNFGELLTDTIAMILGIAMFLAFVLAVVVVLMLLVISTAMLLSVNADEQWGLGAFLGSSTASLLFFGIPCLFYLPMMMAHYAGSESFGSFMQWRTIWRVLYQNLLSLLLLGISFTICYVVMQAAALFSPIADALVSWASSVILTDLWAQVYQRARSQA